MFVQLRNAVGRSAPRIAKMDTLINISKNSRDENGDLRALEAFDSE
jgi:hypothetical protein